MQTDKNCGVYLIVSPTNKRYVGSSKDLKKRINRYKNHNCSGQSAIKASLEKYGFKNHIYRVLYFCDEKELFFWERVFGDLYLASAEFSTGLTITLPGYDDVPQMRSKEFRDRVSNIQKKRFESLDERKKISEATRAAYTDEIRNKMSEIHKKRFEDEKLREHRSIVRKAYYERNPNARKEASIKTKKIMAENSELKEKCLIGIKKYYKDNPTIRSDRMKERHNRNPNLGKEHGQRLKEKYLNNPMLREIASQKTKEHIKKFGHPLSKRIVNIETGEEFESVSHLSGLINIPKQTIRNWLIGVSPNKTNYRYARNY